MTEIKIEKKKAVWPWVVGAFIIIALLIYFIAFNKEETVENLVTDTTEQSSAASNSGAVAAFIEYINDSDTMGLDHSYTNEAFLRLIAAVKHKADIIGHDISADLQKADELANKITRDPFETTHANSIRQAAEILANAMTNMQKAKFPALDSQSAEVMRSARDIDPDELTLDQKIEVKNFFKNASALIAIMK